MDQSLILRQYRRRCLIQYLESSSWLRLVNGTLVPRYNPKKGWAILNLNHRIFDYKCDCRISLEYRISTGYNKRLLMIHFL